MEPFQPPVIFGDFTVVETTHTYHNACSVATIVAEVETWWCRDAKVDRTTRRRCYILTEQIGTKRRRDGGCVVRVSSGVMVGKIGGG
ncbi:hypothetical protein L195_g029599 [Trifolium pratense]|uniref:Uncharacterized protein n=1 Tax=Trifolium pratense TaxID=57577 RepID=A0A2K3L581_TRIPR|nr:hypothetical protein L195_g029599 [Trifolium pratense]